MILELKMVGLAGTEVDNLLGDRLERAAISRDVIEVPGGDLAVVGDDAFGIVVNRLPEVLMPGLLKKLASGITMVILKVEEAGSFLTGVRWKARSGVRKPETGLLERRIQKGIVVSAGKQSREER
ncbi:MAG: hypothetical protein AAGB24_06105 [Bacteroidota bacterium]